MSSEERSSRSAAAELPRDVREGRLEGLPKLSLREGGSLGTRGSSATGLGSAAPPPDPTEAKSAHMNTHDA